MNYNIDNYFSGYEPDLVNKKVMNNFKFVIDKAYKSTPPVIESDNSPSFSDYIYYFYIEYVQSNIIIIFLLLIFVLFLLYRYIMKDDFIKYEMKNESMSNLSLFVVHIDIISFKVL